MAGSRCSQTSRRARTAGSCSWDAAHFADWVAGHGTVNVVGTQPGDGYGPAPERRRGPYAQPGRRAAPRIAHLPAPPLQDRMTRPAEVTRVHTRILRCTLAVEQLKMAARVRLV